MLVDAECQVTCDESGGGLGVSTISREQLQLEVETLCQERDNMIEQLRESTGAFQEQLKFVKDKCENLDLYFEVVLGIFCGNRYGGE